MTCLYLSDQGINFFNPLYNCFQLKLLTDVYCSKHFLLLCLICPTFLIFLKILLLKLRTKICTLNFKAFSLVKKCTADFNQKPKVLGFY